MDTLISNILLKSSAPSTLNSPQILEVLEVCENCGESKRVVLDTKTSCGVREFKTACKCDRELEERKKQERLNLEKFEKINKLRTLSLLGKRYENVRFDNTKTGLNLTFDAAFNRCKKYCEIYEEVRDKGYGIYLFGAKGTGKTHLTACIANELLGKCIPVLLTNLFEIEKAIKATWKNTGQTEEQLLSRFENVDFLFFDDLGTEIFLKNDSDTRMQTLLFNLMNKRYNAKKPTIFSSNYSLNELINLRGVADRTVDRITEMTKGAVMRIEGKSWRNKNHDGNIPF